MKQKKKTVGIATRMVALMLAAVLMAVFVPSLHTHASAFTSLDHIESIKANQSTFNIVEIVPRANTGGIGYYVAGSEPTTNYWMAETAKLVGSSARTAYANGIFSKLQSRGILGTSTTDTSCPLTYVGPYAEKYPWENMTGAAVLPLDNPETVVMGTSTFEYRGINQGAFTLNSIATYIGTAGGDYAQNIDYFVYQANSAAVSADTENYYYDIGNAFTKIILKTDKADETDGTNLEELASGSGTAIYTPVYKTDTNGVPTTEIDHYLYAGTLGAGFMLDVSQTYFYVDTAKLGAAHRGSDSAGLHYYAVTNKMTPYVQVAGGTGCFSMNLSNYVYVGDGLGDYALTDSVSGTSHTITYATVKVAGGYQNRDWLLRHVFDADDTTLAALKAKMKIQVFSVCPNTADPEITNNISKLLTAADLIVLSDGLNIDDGKVAGGYSTVGKVDFTADQITTLSAKQQDGVPILLDSRIATETANSNLMQFSKIAIGAQTTGFVSGSLYAFVPGQTDRFAIATKDFTKELPGYADSDSPYYDVYNEISYENFLRTTANGSTTDKLPTGVSIATCLRYIINYSGQRVVNNKTSVSVLDVEPLTQTSSSGLTKATVAAWLKGSGIADNNITITTMSTAEFISKIENINEVYDLVYIGASLNGFNTSGSGATRTTNFTDNDMDGLIYSNIGDLRNVSGMFTGLMDSDYNNLFGTSHAYRLSGNDITQTKLKELSDFAQSGFPIIVSNDLLTSGQEATPEYKMTVSLQGSYTPGDFWHHSALSLTATVTTDAKGTFEYNWYRNGSSSAIDTYRTTEKQDQLTISIPDSDTYYCTVTLLNQTANSNTVTLGNMLRLNVTDDSTDSSFFPVTLSATEPSYKKEPVTYSASAPYFGEGAVYQWQYRYSSRYSWEDASSAVGTSRSKTIKVPSDYYVYDFRCVVTYQGNEYASKTYYYDNYNTSQKSYGLNGRFYPSGGDSCTLSVGVNVNGTTLTANPSLSPEIAGVNYKYQWQYKTENASKWNDDTGATSSSYGPVTNDNYVYQCRVTVDDINYAYSSTYEVITEKGVTINTTGATTATIPATESTDATVNTDRVDNSSNMYTSLSTLLPYANVMTATEAGKQTNILLKYLNLSKPSINFTAKPTEYTGDTQLGNSLIENNQLVYTFTIQNPTDATPLTTRYSCQLYLDRNADGRYKDSEEISDLLIKDSSGNVVEANQLAAGKSYTMTRKLPSTFSGIIPWHLKITKVGAAQIHTSQTGYTYLQPPNDKATVIKVLQITAKSTDGTTLYLDNTSSIGRSRSAAENMYLGLFKGLKDENVFDIQVKTVTVKEINTYTVDQINSLLADKDMLLLGFCNVYGQYDDNNYGLGSVAASAVVNFIHSGKAVLFSHDTTSYANLPSNYYSHYSPYWGFYFNSVIRDAVGLDRYGVTSPKFGVTSYSVNASRLRDTSSEYVGLVSSGYSNFTTAAENALQSAGYSIAYKPKSNRQQTVPQPQGCIDVRLNESSGYNATNTVSQVNKGQITTFPFNINTHSFCNTTEARYSTVGDTLTIGSTHEQYYQLNMNSDDIAVWFCLAGSNYNSTYKNDGVNAYYIYNRGNVTYSGAGHNPQGTTTDEAKLFINTMIAAYRSAAVNPEINFRSAEDTAVSTQFVPMEYANAADATSAAGTAAENAKIFFKISDANLSADKQVRVALYYKLGDLTLTDEQRAALTTAGGDPADYGYTVVSSTSLQIHRADNGAVVPASDVHSDTLYYFTLPDSVMNVFAQSDQSVITLLGKVTTTIGTKDYIGVSTMQLKKLGFMSLR